MAVGENAPFIRHHLPVQVDADFSVWCALGQECTVCWLQGGQKQPGGRQLGEVDIGAGGLAAGGADDGEGAVVLTHRQSREREDAVAEDDLDVDTLAHRQVDRSRLHAVIPDITRRHTSINIRKFVVRARRLPDLVRMNSLSAGAASLLHAAVESGMNILVSGATQAGKTTMLNCLSASIPPRERVITCEEIFELAVPLRDVVGLQCRQPNLEGTGAIELRRLVKEALRMRPDRILIGEVREAESLDMLIALNAGLPGMCTIHANSARDAVTKICTLPLLAGENISSAFVVPTVASCFDIVVHCGRDSRGQRQVEEISMLGGRVEDGVIEMSPLFVRRDGQMVCVALELPNPDRWIRAGHRPEQVLAAAKAGQ